MDWRIKMEKKCQQCRFYDGKCVKYPVNVTGDCKACNDFAESMSMQESVPVRMQLCD